MHCSLFSLGCVFGFTPSQNSSLTALRALRVAKLRLRPEIGSKLLSISSSRTDATFVPEAWRFIFSDHATTNHCRVVTVASKVSSEHPDTLNAFSLTRSESLASVSSQSIPQRKLLVDSNQVLERVRECSKLKGSLSAEYRLLYLPTGQAPVWNLVFYAEGAEPLASFSMDARTGEIP